MKFALFLILALNVYSIDSIIILKDGEKVRGDMIDENSDIILIKEENKNEAQFILKSSIKKITYPNYLKLSNFERTKKSKKTKKKKKDQIDEEPKFELIEIKLT